MDEAAAAADAAAAAVAEGAPATPVDLATLVGQFTALRHEINLQTRGIRAQQEQTGQVLDLLREALADAEQAERRRAGEHAERQADVLRPLLKALVDARDALALAQRQVAKARDVLGQSPDTPLLTEPALPPPALPLPPAERSGSWWSRLFGSAAANAAVGNTAAETRHLDAWARQLQADTAAAVLGACRQAVAEQAEQAATTQIHLRQTVESILIGYGMSLERLDRALGQAGMQAIAGVDAPFDPEIMEAVEVLYEEGRTGAHVVEVVRPGYLWNGALFRTAQVRVARS